jgi:hypothetical protein
MDVCSDETIPALMVALFGYLMLLQGTTGTMMITYFLM